jgi:GH25 family lysozyme M1 (1,4-beta-N-acetylmuramidase)
VTRHRRRGGIAGSVFLILAATAVTVVARTAISQPAARAAVTQSAALGTDVSNLTTVSSWPDVASAGMTFTGVMAYDGASVANPSYNSQVKGALGEGLFVMPYVIADPLKIAGAAQFARAWHAIDGIAGAPYARGGHYLPVTLDMEAQPQVTAKTCYGLTQAQMVSWIKAFTGAARQQAGVTPVLYTSPGWWQACTGNTTAFAGDPLWIADYGVAVPAIPPGWTGYTFWQSSDTATIAGIADPGQADVDQLEGAVTGKAATSGSFQLQTLNSLAGQPVSYAHAGLPKGVSLSTGGRLSWTSSTPLGAFRITVYAASAARAGATVIPAAVSLTLRLHAPIAVAVANRSSTAGTRISLHVTASGPDKNHGFTPTLTASGLPPGLSMTPAGTITGRLTKPGAFTVTVTAADALGGTGSASFTWTVKAK